MQDHAETILVRYAVRKDANDQKTSSERSDIEKGIIRILGSAVQVKFERVGAIERNRSGRFQWIISSLPQPGSGDTD